MQDALKLNETSCGASKSRVKKSVSYNNKNRPIIILLLYSKLVCRSYIDSLREWPALGSWIIAMHALPTHFFPCFSLFVLSLFCSLFVFSFFFLLLFSLEATFVFIPLISYALRQFVSASCILFVSYTSPLSFCLCRTSDFLDFCGTATRHGVEGKDGTLRK